MTALKLICNVTGNLVGTDSVRDGHVCKCAECRAAALIERMAEALRPFADGYKGREGWNDVAYIGGSNICNGDLRRARDILKELGQ